jgi:transglutaminase-like putative cysteine protease
MRFGVVHRVMTDALAVLGVLAVVSTASMSPWTNALLVSAMVVCLVIPERWQASPALKHFANVAPILLCVVQGTRLVTGRSPLDVAVEFAALLQIIRLATRRGAAHDQQIIVLALLHFVAGTVLGGGLTYGLCFLGFLVVAPGALVLSHLRREVEGNYRQGARDRTGLPVDVPRILRSRRVVGRGFLISTCLLSIPIFVFTAILFVLFPRVGLSLLLLNHPHAGRMVGFSDHVDLGQVGVLRSDPSIALRFEVQNLPEPPPPRMTLRFRGTAFDTYKLSSWDRTSNDHFTLNHAVGDNDSYPLLRSFDAAHDTKISIDLEPIDPPVLFLPPRTVGVRLRPVEQSLLSEALSVVRGPEGEFRYVGTEGRGIRYEAYLAGDREGIAELLAPDQRPRYLTVPVLPERVAALAHQWADAEPTPAGKAHAIEEHLKHDFRYDTASPSGGAAQPVDHFLFESRRGHCEFFSTSMALMLRYVGIPSRNVTGFVGGTYNRFGHYYAVREGDAHSWVEAYIDSPRPGWVTFDPTPAAGAQPLEETTGILVYVRDLLEAASQRWNTYVVRYDLQTQIRMFDDVHRRYEALRSKTGTNRGGLERWTRPSPLLAGLLLVAALLAYLWRQRRRFHAAHAEDDGQAPRDPHLEAAAALYRMLEGALSVHGIIRPSSLPPLRHAMDLTEQRHPLAPEVLALTHLYLDTRFGHASLTDADRRDFERRVREVRSSPPVRRPETSGPDVTASSDPPDSLATP